MVESIAFERRRERRKRSLIFFCDQVGVLIVLIPAMGKMYVEKKERKRPRTRRALV
jgi:hypothetical protein